MGLKYVIVAAMGVAASTAAFAFFQGGGQAKPSAQTAASKMLWSSPERKDKVVLTPAEWRKKLTGFQYNILRESGTERAFANDFYNNHREGAYYCAGCGLALFSSDNKFESGTGWPSFYKPVDQDNVWFLRDTSTGTLRIEVRCSRCDGHLGHVFDDAPQTPTGLRYCMNSGAMTFKKKQ